MTTDPTLATDEAASTPTPKSFWNLTTCCGCLVVFFILAVIGFAIGTKMLLDQFLPKEPYDFERVTYTDEESVAARSHLDQLETGDEVAFTPRELTILLQSAFDEKGDELRNGKFSIEPTDDGQVRFQMSLELPEGFFKGRWVSVDLTASGEIEERKPLDFKVSEFAFGGYRKSFTEEESKEIWKSMKVQFRQQPELQEVVDQIRNLRIQDGKVSLRIYPPDEEEPSEAEATEPESPEESKSEEPK